MKEKVLEILMNIRDDIDYENATSLMDDKLFSSLDLISLISELDNQLGIPIPATEIKTENFNSVDLIISLLTRLSKK